MHDVHHQIMSRVFFFFLKEQNVNFPNKRDDNPFPAQIAGSTCSILGLSPFQMQIIMRMFQFLPETCKNHLSINIFYNSVQK